MPLLPAATAFTAAGVTEAQFKTAISDQREFLAGLLGTDGTPASARAALGISVTDGAYLNGLLSKFTTYAVAVADK